MANDMNTVILIGNLVRDPEIRYTKSGTAVANFSIASNREWSQDGEKKSEASFFSVIAWTKLGELIVKYCQKGHRVAIEGRLQQRNWTDSDNNKRSTVEIVASNVQFLTPKSEGNDGTVNRVENAPQDEQPNFDDIDEIAF